MHIYLINLARRPDRLAAMTVQAARLGLSLTRVDGIDAAIQDPNAMAAFDDNGPLGEIPRGDRCCTLSHIKAWRTFIADGADHAVFLEDDVILSDGAAVLLQTAAWIPPTIGLLKLEHYGPRGQGILVSNTIRLNDRFVAARLRSRHTGAAAYILSRAAALTLLAVERFSLPVDHLLFNPNNSPLFAALGPWQLIPALARQQNFVGEKSDIENWRVGLRKRDWTYAKREAIRFGYDLKLLPRQLALVLTGRAKFLRIRTEG